MTTPREDALYKITGPNGESIHGGRGKWPLPKDGKPGTWRSVRGELIPCENGLHVVEAAQLALWVKLDAVVWEVETAGQSIDSGDKAVVRRARLTHRVGTLDRPTLVAWACDCAERALPIFEKRHPKDDRPRKAIETTRAWLRGEARTEQVQAAADAAAYAADAAAYAAAYAAADADAAAKQKARDEVLATYAEDIVQILIEMNAPGCQWLALTEAA